jgi:hypothetical protein
MPLVKSLMEESIVLTENRAQSPNTAGEISPGTVRPRGVNIARDRMMEGWDELRRR